MVKHKREVRLDFEYQIFQEKTKAVSRQNHIPLPLYLFAQLGYYSVKPVSDRHSRHTQSPVPNQTHDTFR